MLPPCGLVNELIRERLIEKYYLCVVFGHPVPKEATLKNFLLKDEREKLVSVFDQPRPGARTAMTKYRVTAETDRFSLLEVELLTGRTHQIRAQMAYAGHPLLGDTKYGTPLSTAEPDGAFRRFMPTGSDSTRESVPNIFLI